MLKKLNPKEVRSQLFPDDHWTEIIVSSKKKYWFGLLTVHYIVTKITISPVEIYNHSTEVMFLGKSLLSSLVKSYQSGSVWIDEEKIL
jgi:hypothetical protein